MQRLNGVVVFRHRQLCEPQPRPRPCRFPASHRQLRESPSPGHSPVVRHRAARRRQPHRFWYFQHKRFDHVVICATMYLLRVQTGISRSKAVTRVTARRNKGTGLQPLQNRLSPSPLSCVCSVSTRVIPGLRHVALARPGAATVSCANPSRNRGSVARHVRSPSVVRIQQPRPGRPLSVVRIPPSSTPPSLVPGGRYSTASPHETGYARLAHYQIPEIRCGRPGGLRFY